MASDFRSADVVIAEYLYRHEAEFAAGFLADAGIPFRLQADDAGGIDAGVTIARPARIWVRREDQEAARELLDYTPDAAVPDYEADYEEPARGMFVPKPTTPSSGDTDVATLPRDRLPGRPTDPSVLCGAERAVAVTIGGAFVAIGGGVGGIAPPGRFGIAWTLGMIVVGLVLLISAMVGRSWGPFRSLLRALSGVAP